MPNKFYNNRNAVDITREEAKDEPKIEIKTEAFDTAVKARPEKPTVVKKVATVVCDRLNIRREPSTDADILETVSKGAQFPVVTAKSTADFTAIELDKDKIAYVMTEFVSVA